MTPKNLKIIPQQRYLLIEINELPTEELVAMPEGAHRFPYGDVLAVGPDCKFTKVGDKVLFMAGNVIQFNHPEGDYFILSEDAVMGKYEFDDHD
jgi:co-chaperonin GroES (HSP10)